MFASENKPRAVSVLTQNHPGEAVHGDIREIDANTIPDFDFLLAGFPCQAFSAAGKRLGFQDNRGNLFFEVERIQKIKKPYGFVLENVDGPVNHDRKSPHDDIGKTFSTILEHLSALEYEVNRRVLDAKFFGVAQERKRVYNVGTKKKSRFLKIFRSAANG